MSIFKMSPEELLAARNDLPADKRESFDDAIKSAGLTVATPDDPEIARLHSRFAVQHNAQPTDYHFQYRDPDSVKVEDDTAARNWAAAASLPAGFAAGILDRLQETAAEVASLSPADLNDRKLKAEAKLGKEQYDQIVSKAKAVAGDLKFVKPGQIETDMWLAGTLARFADARTSLQAAIEKRGAKK